MAMFYLFVCVFCSFYGCHTYCLMLLVFTFMPDLFCECWLIYMFLMCFNVFRPWRPCYYGLLLHRFLALVFFLRLPWWLSFSVLLLHCYILGFSFAFLMPSSLFLPWPCLGVSLYLCSFPFLLLSLHHSVFISLSQSGFGYFSWIWLTVFRLTVFLHLY